MTSSPANYFQLDDDWEEFKNCASSIDFDCDVAAAPPRSNAHPDDFVLSPTLARMSDMTNMTKMTKNMSNSSGDTLRSPNCSPIYISTTTKIAYMNLPVDIKRVFWEIPVLKYTDPIQGVIKKQIKFSTTDRDEYDAVMERISKERYYDNQEMEHIDNPEGRIKFKDQRKISIGLSKKDILCYRSKKKERSSTALSLSSECVTRKIMDPMQHSRKCTSRSSIPVSWKFRAYRPIR